MADFAKRLSDPPLVEECNAFAPAIPHIIEATTTWQSWLTDENFIFPYLCLGRFYAAQGALNQAAHWYEQCLTNARNRLGSEHLAIAASLTHLANVYYAQDRYQEAEPFYQGAIQLLQQLLGEDDLATAISLTNLANLYKAQDRYREAKPLYQQALDLFQRQLEEENQPFIASLTRCLDWIESKVLIRLRQWLEQNYETPGWEASPESVSAIRLIPQSITSKQTVSRAKAN